MLGTAKRAYFVELTAGQMARVIWLQNRSYSICRTLGPFEQAFLRFDTAFNYLYTFPFIQEYFIKPVYLPSSSSMS